MNDHSSPRSALEVGKALDRMVKTAGPEGLNTQRTEQMVEALATAPCASAADLLAVLAHANGVVQHARAVLQDTQEDADPQQVASLLGWALLLHSSAIATLENATGLSADGFLGTGPTVN